MKTMLINSKRTPVFDTDLLQALKISELGTVIDENDNLVRIGVQNEEGEVYRIIGADDVLEFAHIIRELEANHWPIENRAPDTMKSFHAVVHPPEEIQLKAQGIDPEDPGSAA
jgi:hypothetical protein